MPFMQIARQACEARKRRLQVVKWFQKEDAEKKRRSCWSCATTSAIRCAEEDKKSSALIDDMSPNPWYIAKPSRIIVSTWSYWKCMEILNQSNRNLRWKWRGINCGFKKSISANHCNKSRFSLSCTEILANDDKKKRVEIQFRIFWGRNLFPH